MVSADNAHALHPNHPELSDKDNAPVLGGGVAVKYNPSGNYTTDAVSDAVFRTVCERAGVKTQSFRNRADMPGGSTLGAISDTVVSVPSVDIGLPQLAMHSACETMAKCDLDSMTDALKEYFNTAISFKGGEIKLS
jgi:aspartyl aminopeptidase